MTGLFSRRYAKALLSIAIEKREQDKVAAELESLSSLYQHSAELKDALLNAVFPLSQRQAVLSKIASKLGLSRSVENMAHMLLSRGKFSSLPNVAREFLELSDVYAGRVRATLVTASAVELQAELRVKNVLEKISSKQVVLKKEEDPAILGGFLLKFGDIVYDGSVSTQLEHFRQQLVGESHHFYDVKE